MKVGVVVWAEGTFVKFRIAEGVRVERGELLKVYDRGVKYILRVIDFRPESLLTPAEIARLSHKRERGEEFVLYDKDLRLYDTAVATIIAQIDEEDGNVHGPTSVPALFTHVETLDEIDLEQLNLDNGDLAIGVVRIGHRPTNVMVRLKGEKVFSHHVLVCGVTGAGKSNFGKVLAYAVMKTEPKYSLILFDTENEYFSGIGVGSYGLAHLREAEERLFYVTTLVDEPGIVEFNLECDGITVTRRISTYPLKISYSQLHPLDFILTGEFTSAQEELLWLAWKTKREKWLEFLIESTSMLIYRALSRMVHVNTINTVKRKLRYMLGSGSIFKKEELDIDLFKAIIGAVCRSRVVLVDMPYVGEGEEKLLVASIARRIFKTYENLRKRDPLEWEQLPYAMIMVEEAHKYLSKQSLSNGTELKENIFSIISKRGRKYKVSGLYITQMPGELIEPVIRQTLTKIVFSLPTRPDYQKIVEYSPYLDEAEQEIKALDRGEALLVSPVSGMRFAVPVKIFSFDELVEEDILEERLEAKLRKEYSW